ncbi:PCAT1 acyltransferase, partial [Polyodon spathula]|nr:PCAT1 acyltransferase [Polyodon spathula]
MTVTLFPIRLFFAAFMMLLAWPFAFLASMGRSEKVIEPLSWWRKVFDFLLKVIMRAMWFAGGFHWMTVKGRQALPTEAPILTLAPHSSYFDAIPVTMTMASIVMKAESKDIPVWGTLIKYIRPVFVSRSDQDSRKKTVEEIKRRAHSEGKWPQIMIFPEGTCTNRSCLITFKPGAFIPAVPVQPVVLRYPNKMLHYGATPTSYIMGRHQQVTLCNITFFLNEDGTMDAREYVIALSVVCKPCKTLETIKLAFKMYESEQDQTILEEHLACILKTALGVSELNVTDLFRAIDILEKGKITFDDFNDFAEQRPDFAEEYLYPDQTRFQSCAQTPSGLIANGFCTDFSPEDQYEEERRPLRKKLN